MEQPNDSLQARLRLILAEVISLTPEELDATLDACDGVLDSLQGVELLLAVEEEYGVTIPDDAIDPTICRSFPALVQRIRALLEQCGVLEVDTTGKESS